MVLVCFVSVLFATDDFALRVSGNAMPVAESAVTGAFAADQS